MHHCLLVDVSRRTPQLHPARYTYQTPAQRAHLHASAGLFVFAHLCATSVRLRVSFSHTHTFPPYVCSDGWGLAAAVSAPGEQSRPRARGGGTVVVNCLTWPSVYTISAEHTHTHTHSHNLRTRVRRRQEPETRTETKGRPVCLGLFNLLASSPWPRGEIEQSAAGENRDPEERNVNAVMGDAVELRWKRQWGGNDQTKERYWGKV